MRVGDCARIYSLNAELDDKYCEIVTETERKFWVKIIPTGDIHYVSKMNIYRIGGPSRIKEELIHQTGTENWA